MSHPTPNILRYFDHPMTSPSLTDIESADVDKVDAALQSITSGRLDEAETLLLGVIANTPSDYANTEETGDVISIKFWDETTFIHYVTWEKHHGRANKTIKWLSNAYPRAYFHMGFLCVKHQQFDKAINYLEKGQALEPTNPKFSFEKAKALASLGRKEEALALYAHITEISAYVSAHDLAIALRGRGFVLIEMGDLDNAELAFQSSLKIEPDNEVALNELSYINHLRQGGAANSTETVLSTSLDLSNCRVCGQPFDEGVVVSFKGSPVSICQQCQQHLTKKWWQFWK